MHSGAEAKAGCRSNSQYQGSGTVALGLIRLSVILETGVGYGVQYNPCYTRRDGSQKASDKHRINRLKEQGFIGSSEASASLENYFLRKKAEKEAEEKRKRKARKTERTFTQRQLDRFRVRRRGP